MVVGRNPVVFQAYARLSFPVNELFYRAALFFYLTPRNISLSLCIYLVKCTFPSPFFIAIYVLALTFYSSSFLSYSASLILTSDKFFKVSFALSTQFKFEVSLIPIELRDGFLYSTYILFWINQIWYSWWIHPHLDTMVKEADTHGWGSPEAYRPFHHSPKNS